jgi:RNA-binding protein YlmH
VKSLTELKIDNEALLDSILSNSNIAYKTWKIKSIERFLDPEELFAIESAFKDIVAVEYRFFGGYPQAERKVAYFHRVSAQDTETEFNNGGVEDISEIEKDFRYFKISGNFIFEKLTLSEFRNSIIDLFNIKNYQVRILYIILYLYIYNTIFILYITLCSYCH